MAVTAGEAEGDAPTAAELATVLRLLERLGARSVAVGHGRDPRSQACAERFAAAWTAAPDRDGLDRQVAVVVDWPSEAASWLKPARRLTEVAVDAWVVADTPAGWAAIGERLRRSDGWDPRRTIGFAGLVTSASVAAAGPGVTEGLVGAAAGGDVWFVHEGTLVEHRPRTPEGSLESLVPRPAVEVAPGAVHVPGWLTIEQQQELVVACRGWARGPAPMRRTRLPSGGTMSVQTVCLGWHWQPYRYTRTAEDLGGLPVAPFPDWLAELGRRALVDAYGDPAAGDGYAPDAALINFYDADAKMGLHQDKDERSDAPVVSLSIGESCLFRLGNVEDRGAPYTDVELRSGDLFVFGGPSRFAFHGVPRKIQSGTVPPATGLTGGRLNLTLRVTGLD